MTHIDGPVGTMTGQSIEIQEAIWCLNGDACPELTELVCTLGMFDPCETHEQQQQKYYY